MESDKSVKLSISEKADIFEYVNTMYLNLKGAKKKQTKQSFKTAWKEDNMCYILMMKLSEVYDEWSEKEQNEDWIFDKMVIKGSNTTSISMVRHKTHLNFMREDLDEKEKELEKVKQGKGYMSQETHDEAMKQCKEEKEEIIREQGHTIAKLRNKESYHIDKMLSAEKKLEAQRLYYTDQINRLSKEQ